MNNLVEHGWIRGGAIGGLFVLFLTAHGNAQDSVRSSLAGVNAAEARVALPQAPSYNLKVGPISFDLRGELGMEYNDNVNIADVNPQEDFILRPQIMLNAFWQVTQQNALNFDLGLSYAKYLDHDELDTNSVLIAPNSRFSFDIFIADFRINLHDRFSISQDPIDEGALSNVGDFGRFENAAGISVLWDGNDVKVVAGYDLYSFKSLTGGFEFLDRLEHQFSASVAATINDGLTVGVDAGCTLVRYDESFNNDAFNYQFGPFLEVQVSNYLKARLAGGYQAAEFDSGGLNEDDSDPNGPFGVLTLVNRLNNYFSQELSGGYETRLGLTTNYIETAFVRYGANWKMNRIINLRLSAFYEHLNESSGLFAEEADRLGAALSLDFQVTRKSSVGLEYQFTHKDSDLLDRDYDQNRVVVHVAYDL